MKVTVYEVTPVVDEVTENTRINFVFGSEVDCIENTFVFMTTDKEKALKSTSIWVRSLLPDEKFPNVKGLMRFKNMDEETAQEHVLALHTKALQSLIGKQIDIYQETVYINGKAYNNWLPYEPYKKESKEALSDSEEELTTDVDVIKEGF